MTEPNAIHFCLHANYHRPLVAAGVDAHAELAVQRCLRGAAFRNFFALARDEFAAMARPDWRPLARLGATAWSLPEPNAAGAALPCLPSRRCCKKAACVVRCALGCAYQPNALSRHCAACQPGGAAKKDCRGDMRAAWKASMHSSCMWPVGPRKQDVMEVELGQEGGQVHCDAVAS